MDIRERRERLDFLLPRIEKLILDVRFADMVQDELDMRTLFHEPNCIGELRVENTDVETQSVARERFDTAHKVGLNTEINAFGLDEAADTFDESVLRQFFDERSYLCAFFERCQATMP